MLDAPGGRPRLIDAPRPRVGPGDVLVRIGASSVNLHEAHVISGRAREYLEYQFPVTLGNDFAGEIVEVGSDVTGLEVGDEVFGVTLEPIAHRGTFADMRRFRNASSLLTRLMSASSRRRCSAWRR